jgi:head-tail adaptor
MPKELVIRSGEYNQLATFQYPATTQSLSGMTQTSWITLGQFWIKITPLKADETVLAQNLRADQLYKIETAFPTGSYAFTTAMQIIWQGLTLQVLGIQNVQMRNIKLVIVAKQITAAGAPNI